MKIVYSLAEAVENKLNKFLFFTENTLFPICLNYRGFDKWVVFFPGAYNRDKLIPSFQRGSYVKKVNANSICLFDPGLFLSKEITLAWFSGGEEYHARILGAGLRNFFISQDVRFEKILLFGTSAGGLPAFEVSRSLPGCVVWGGNIQTNGFKHPAFRKMRSHIFPGLSIEEIRQHYSERLMIEEKRDLDKCKFILFQNKADRFHYYNHFIPFVNFYRSELLMVDQCSGKFFTYDDPEAGHGIIGVDNEIQLINDIIECGEPIFDWVERI